MFECRVKETSMELTKRAELMLTDTSKAMKLDKVVNGEESIVIKPTDYAILDVHNDKAKGDKDYTQYIILTDGDSFITGSESFWNAFKHIWDVMDGDDFEVEIYKLPSKNYEGKDFLTCSIV